MSACTKGATAAAKDTSDDSAFDEWRELFNAYRNAGGLPADKRARFKWLSEELRRRGFFR